MATTWTYSGQNATLGGLTSPIPSSGSATSNLNDGSSSTYEGYSSVSLPDHRVIGFITWDEDIHLEAIAASAVCWHVSGGGTGAYQIDYATSTSGSTWTTLASGAMAVETAASVAAAIGEGLSADGAGVLANRIRVVVQHTTATEGGAALRELTAFRAGEAGCSAPATPAGLAWSGLCEGDQVTLYWNASVDADGYVLKVDGGEEIDVGNVTSYALTSGITAGTDYDITIAAYNDCGTSAYTGTAVVVSPCDPDCDEPVGPYTPPSESPRVTTILSSRAGVRKTLPGHHVQKCAWSEERYGGFTRFDVTLAITPEELVAYGTTLELSDRVEFWWNGTEGSVNTRYFRGYVHTIAHAEGEPYTITLSGHGLSMRAGQCVVDESYLYPSPADISVPFASLVNDHVIPILSPDFTTLVVSAADVDATVQVVESTNKQFGDVINNLTQQQGANLSLWGYDVSSDGDDRLYLKPFGTAIAYTLAVPGLNTVAARGDRSDAELVNDLTIVGGNPRFPNLVYNSSFERPRFGGDGTGNLIPNGGFETTSDWSGTGSYKSSGASTGEGSAYAGSRMYETDNSGEYAQQTVNPPSTAIVVGNDYVFSCQAKCEDESVAVTGLITLTWLTSGGSTISTVTQALDTPTGASVTKLQSAWQQYTFTSRAPATAAGFKIRIETDSGGGIEQGILWDALELYDASVVYQDGWELVADGTAVINSVNWQAQDPRGAADGNYALYVDVSASDADANEARLQPVGQQKLQIDGGGAYTISLALLSPPGVTANGKMQLVIKEFKSDGSAVGSPTTYTIAAGSGWTSWTRVSTTRTADQRSSHFLVYLAFRGNSQVLIDAFAVRDSTVSSEYIRDGSLTLHYDTDSADLPDLSAAAQDSIADYGRRPGIVTVDTITTTADAIAYATAYFNAYAIAFPSPAIEVVNPYQYFRTGELVKLVGPDGADMMGDETSLPIVRASWSWDGLLKCSLELKKERPDLVSLLLRKIKKALGASYSSSSIAGSPPSTVGSGTVTSVGLTMPSAEFNVAGSPITDDDTLVVTWDNQSANTGLMGPTSGGAGGVGFRALVAADIPQLPISKIDAAAGSRLFGRYTGSAGAGQEISIGTGLSLDTGTGVLSNTGAAGVADGDKGDVTVSSSGAVWTIDANVVSNAKFRQSAGISVVGRSANTTGDVADITAGTDGHALRLSGTTLGFGQIATAGIADDAVTYAKIQNVSATDRLLGRDTAGAGDIEELTVGGGVEFTGTGIQRSALTGDVTASAGSNSTTIATNAVTDAKFRQSAGISVVGRSANTTGNVADITAVTDGHALRLSGTTLGFGTIATAGIADAAVTDAKLRDSAALSVIGRASNSTGDPADIAAGSDHQVLRRSGTSLGFGAVNLSSSSAVTPPGSDTYLLYNASGAVGAESALAYNYTTNQLSVPGLTIGEDLVLGMISPSQITGDQNDYAPTGHATATGFFLTSDASRTITGIAGGAAARALLLVNIGLQNIILADDSSSSSAANRFQLPSALTLLPATGVWLVYDGANSRWVMASPWFSETYTGTVTSVALSAPAEISVSGSPVTSSGTLGLTWANQTQNKVFASPNGSTGTPAFRALVAADIPSLSYVTSVALSAPAIFSVSGSPVTSSGTLALSLATQVANRVWAGPSSGADAAPTFRALVSDDIPSLAISKIASAAASRLFGRYAGTAGAGQEITIGTGLSLDSGTGALSCTVTGISDGDKGDITVSGSGTTWTIDNDAVTYAKIQNVSATDRLLGRDTAGAGDIEELTVSGGVEFTGTGIQRSALTGDVTASAGSNSTTIATNAVTDAKFRQSAGISVVGRSANTTGNVADITAVTDGHALRLSGTTLGFGTIATAGIADAAVTDAKLRNSAALSVIGRASNSSGAPADIAAGANGNLLRRASNALAFGTISLADSNSVTTPGSNNEVFYRSGGVLGSSAGFTYDGSALYVSGDLQVQSDLYLGRVSPTQITADQNNYSSTTDNFCWRISSDAPRSITGLSTSTPSVSIMGKTFALLNVGSYDITLVNESASSTAANRFSFGADLTIGPGESALIWYDPDSTRWRLLAHSVAPGAAGVSDGDKGDITVSSSGAVWTIDANVVTDAKFRQGAALSVVGVTGNATANVADIAAGTDHQVLRRSGTALAFGAVNLAQSAAVTGALAIGNGGTGQTTQTAAFDALAPTTTKGDLIVSNGTDNIRLAVGTNNYVLTADSAEASGVKWAAAAGGGTPAGSDTYLQYNASGAFGAEAALAYDYTNNQLSAPGLTVTEDFVLSGDITPTQITATQNDYSPTGYATASVFRLSSDAARSITGIAGGADGRFLVVLNVGSYTITFENADTGSTAANRFSMGSDLALEAGQGCILLYDSTQSRWTLATPRLSTTAPFAIDYIGTTGDANYNYCRVYIVTDSTSTQSIGADFAAQGGGLAIVRNKKASGSLTVDASSGWNMADGNTTLAVGESAIYQIGQLGGSGTNIILTLLKTASGSSPAGSSAQIQYNDSGSFGAEAGFEYDAANNQATIPGLTVTQDVALSGDITPSQITSNQNDYAPTDHATTTRWRLSSDAARTITGIAGGADGRILILSNVGSYPITLADDADTSSSAANRLDLGGSDYRIAPSQTIFLCYDSTLSRWTLLDTPARVHYLEYTAAGTTSSISIPTWATKMHVSACGGGGGGGGGARNDTSGANCTGGGGGGGAGVVNTHIHDVAALLAVATTFDVTVGAGGTGGAGATNGAGAAGSNGSGGGNSRVIHNGKYIMEALGANAGGAGQNGATGGSGAAALSVNQVQNQWSVNAGANGGSGDGNGSNAVNNANNPGSGGGGGSLGAGNATKTGGNGGRGHLTFGGISRTAASGGSGNGDPGDAASTSNFLRGQFGDGGGGGASHPSGVGGDGGAGFRGGGGGGGGAGRGGNGGAGGNGGDGYVLLVFTK